MEWLQDKKNMPIVAGLAGIVLLGMIGLILFEMGVFPGGAPAAPPSASSPMAAAGPNATRYPGGSMQPVGAQGYPGGAPGGH